MERNPYRDADRRFIQSDREQFNEDSAHRRFAEQKARIKQNPKKGVKAEFDQPGETSPSTSEKAEG
jgi:hypothetical protein